MSTPTTGTSQLQQAIRAALEPWSTVDHKLGALAYLESVGSPEAFAALRQAMELVGLYVAEKDKEDPHLPKAGEVAGAAALALARLDELGGVRELLRLLLSKEERLVVRECAAYGLGATESKSVFEAYQKAIEVENEVVFSMLIKSMDTSFRRLDGISTEYSEDLLVYLFEWSVDQYRHEKPIEKLLPLLAIISSNLNSKQQRDLLHAEEVSKDSFFREISLAIWLNIDSDIALEAVSKALQRKGERPIYYQKIADKYAASPPALLKVAATKVINSSLSLNRLFNTFSVLKRDSQNAQIAAAKRILKKKKH